MAAEDHVSDPVQMSPAIPTNAGGLSLNVMSGDGCGVIAAGAGDGYGMRSLNGVAQRKRGRPRKYEAGGKVVVSPSPLSEASSKRRPGRPKGSGGIVSSTAGRSFIPFMETVNKGEDVVEKVSSYFQKGCRAACVLSATGTVSSATICQPGTFGGTLTYEGRFEILTLSGSFAFSETTGVRRKISMLSVSLAKPDGRVFGGAVAGSLIAAGPIQLVIASFKQNLKKELQLKRSAESSMAAACIIPGGDSVRIGAPAPATGVTDGEENSATPTSELSEPNNAGSEPNNAGAGDIILAGQNMNIASLESVCWDNSQPSLPMSEPNDIP